MRATDPPERTMTSIAELMTHDHRSCDHDFARAETLGGGITFSFFALMMVLQGFFAWKIMPETKGTSLENSDITVLAH